MRSSGVRLATFCPPSLARSPNATRPSSQEMPELPEVETVRRTLAPHIEGRRIETVVFHWARTCVGDPAVTAERLAGQRIESLDRRGKYLLFRLRKGGKKSYLTVHLRMTGNLLLNGEPGPYTRAEMLLSGGSTVGFNDVRKFGKWEWSPSLPERLERLGPEPLEISQSEFATRLGKRTMRLKPLLLDQGFLRGLGNIYADEALFRARLHPEVPASSVGPRKARALHGAIQRVLSEAIEAGGSSISNYVDGRGSRGYFQLQTQVYGKHGSPCVRCGTALRRIVLVQRGTHYCPRCQRRRRTR